MVLEEFLAEWRNSSSKILVHTSGSTGTPKPLWVEKNRMKASAQLTCNFLGLKADDTALLCMPLDYIAGKMMVVRALVQQMRLISVEPSSRPLRDLQSSPDFAAMVPMQVYESLKYPHDASLLKNIKHLIIGGGAIDKELAAKLKTFPYAVWSTYGMTETLSHIALRRLNGDDASDWYMPFENVSIRIAADGCLCIHAPLVCAEDIKTNDRAEISSDGCRFRIIGRKDNVIDSGGIKIQIEELEQRLKTYIDHSFLITKCNDAKFGEAVVLMVAINNKDSKVTVSTFKDICQKHLSKYCRPKHILFIQEIPLTGTGKIARSKAEDIANEMLKGE